MELDLGKVLDGYTQRLLTITVKLESLIDQVDDSDPVYVDGEQLQIAHLEAFKGFLQKCAWAEGVLLEIKEREIPKVKCSDLLLSIDNLLKELERIPANYNELLEAELD